MAAQRQETRGSDEMETPGEAATFHFFLLNVIAEGEGRRRKKYARAEMLINFTADDMPFS